MSKYFILFLLGTGLLACSPLLQPTVIESRTVIKDIQSDKDIDSLIAPYSRELAKTMNEVIGKADKDLTVSRPNSTLGHWVCDRLIDFAQDSLKEKSIPIICVLNTGGLRAPIIEGNVTVGDIFKVMPFDNQISIVKIKKEKLIELVDYLNKNGGEPIAGCKLIDGKLTLNQLSDSPFVYVVTSDFLANGGDKMSFLMNPIEKIDYQMLIRDLLIMQIRKDKTIFQTEEERIKF